MAAGLCSAALGSAAANRIPPLRLAGIAEQCAGSLALTGERAEAGKLRKMAKALRA